MSILGKTLPAPWYYESGYFEKERKAIFASEWLYAGEQVDLQKKGDYLTFELAGYPLLLIVDEQQKIRGFHNVCRHRAAPLLTDKKGCHKSSALTCRYHGWTYNLSGQLVQAPFCDKKLMQPAEDFSLFEIQVGIFKGLVFVNLDKNAPAFDQSYQAVLQTLVASEYPMEDYNTHASMSKEGNFNWKVWVDGYQECYHCMTIHPVLNKDFSLSKYKIENKEKFSLHSCERKDQSTLGSFNGLWLWVYPNLGLPCYEPCFYTLQVNPISSTQTQLNYRFRFKESVDQATRDEFISVIEKITMEDITICEKVQKNLSAGIFQHGFLSPERENGVDYFHHLVKNAIQEQPLHG
jgi:choline monooxygenase